MNAFSIISLNSNKRFTALNYLDCCLGIYVIHAAVYNNLMVDGFQGVSFTTLSQSCHLETHLVLEIEGVKAVQYQIEINLVNSNIVLKT